MKIAYKIMFAGLAIMLLNGCVDKGTVCISPDKDPIRIEVIKNNDNVLILKDRMNLFSEATYTNVKIKDSKISATKSTLSMFLTTSGIFASNKIVLDFNDRTATVGDAMYNCDDKFAEEVAKLKE